MERLKLGKKPPKYNCKTLKLPKYVSPELPSPPEKVYREYRIPDDAWKMFSNDICSDCTMAAIAHLIMLFTSHTGKLVVPDEADIIKAYSAVSGYDPNQTDADGNNLTDNGAAITDTLNYWQTVGVAGHKILGWAQIDYRQPVKRAQAVWLFGALDVGVQLPVNAQDQFDAKESFEVVKDDGGIDGGHCIINTGYGSEGENYVTWGRGYQKASRAWTNHYVDEAYVIFTNDWIEQVSGLSPSGFNVDQLRADLKAIAA